MSWVTSRFWVILILLACTQGAVAQTDDQEVSLFSLSLEEVLALQIESASKRPEQISEIPASVIIITRRDIERMGYATLEEIIAHAPGLYHIDNYEDFLIGVRGTVGGSIAFLVNGILNHPVRIKGLTIPERSRLNIPVEAIDRIEIVRGPMSVIYGNNAFSGSINVITNQAEKPMQGLVSAALGNRETYKAFARIAAGDDRDSITVNAGWYKTEGIGGRFADVMSEEQLAGLHPDMHTSLDGDLSNEPLYLDLSWSHGSFTTDVRFSHMEYGFYVFTPSFDDGNRLDLQTFHGALSYSSDLSKTMSINGGLIYSSETYDLEFDFLSPTLQGHQLQGTKRLEGDLVLRQEPTDRLSVLAGLRHQRIFDIDNRISLAEIGLDAERESDDVISNDAFLQVDYDLHDRLEIVAGARWSRIGSYTLLETSNPGDSDAVVTSNHYQAESILTPRLAAIYSIDEHNVFKAMVGEATQNNIEPTFRTPEEIRTTELCYLAVYPSWSLSLSAFQNSLTNILRKIQRYNPETGEYEKTVDNSGKWRTLGIEAILKLNPAERFYLQLSSIWQDTEDRNNPEIQVGNSPQLLAKAEAAYYHDKVTLAVNVDYVDSILADWQWQADASGYKRIGNEVGSYFLVGANIRYRPTSRLYLNAHISNLLDEEIRYPASELVNFQYGAFGPGRRVLVTVGWELDLQ
jgi:outer membrane receptor protein involved in Fe transport